MFSNLLSELDTAIRDAKKSIKKVTSQLPASAVSDRQEIEISKEYDPRLKSGVAVSFPKSDRFKQPEKQQLTSSYYDEMTKVVEENRGIAFGKSQRFKKQSNKKIQTILYPKDTLTKKASVGIKINPSKDLSKSIVSTSTAVTDTIADFGPGMYIPKNQIKNTTRFGKGKRFQNVQSKYTDQIPLYPKETLTKKRPPSAAVMKKQTAKNQKQLLKQKEQFLLQGLKILQWNQIPLQIDRYYRNSIGPVLKKEYFNIQNLKGTKKKAAMKMLLDRFNYLRGGFEQNIQKDLEAPCAVVYRKSAPKPFKFLEFSPSPDQYYPVDDLVKPSAPAFSFGKFDLKKIVVPQDLRDYEVGEDILKNVPNTLIFPEHKHIALSQQELAALNRGPGFYDAIFSQVQKRADIGVIKIPNITQKNDRTNNLGQKKQVNDGIYYPDFSAIDKNVGVPLYKQPANVKPQHLPQTLLFPEHWEFYDGDLNKVRAEVAKNIMIAGGLSFDEYKVYSENIKQFKAYLQRQKRNPQHGDYSVTYKGIDKQQPGFEMDKMQEKGLIDPIVKSEDDVEGDNLLLKPEKPKPKIPSINFQKMVGRQEIDDSDEPNPGDILVLNPKLPQQKLPNIDFKKMVGRQEKDDPESAQIGPEGDRLILNPVVPQPHVAQIDFKKHQGRQQIDSFGQQKQQIKIDVNYKPVQPRVKGFVDMERMKEVRLVAYLKKKKQNQSGS